MTRKTRSRFGARFLTLPVLSVVMAGIALGVSVYQAATSRHYSNLAVRPHVIITPYTEGPGMRTGLYLDNDGLGPALLKDIRITVSGQTFHGFGSSPLADAAKAAGLNPMCFARSWPKEGAWLKVDHEVPFLAQTKATDVALLCTKEALRLVTMVDMKIEVDYADLDGEMHQFKGDSRTNDADAFALSHELGN